MRIASLRCQLAGPSPAPWGHFCLHLAVPLPVYRGPHRRCLWASALCCYVLTSDMFKSKGRFSAGRMQLAAFWGSGMEDSEALLATEETRGSPAHGPSFSEI